MTPKMLTLTFQKRPSADVLNLSMQVMSQEVLSEEIQPKSTGAPCREDCVLL